MKKIFIMFLMVIALQVVSADVLSVTTPTYNKFSAVPGTTIYFDRNRFNDLHQADTLIFSKARGFTVDGESTAVFITGTATAGFLTASVHDDSSVILTTTAITDTNKYYWWQIIVRR